jgi:hypothetical protein
MGTGQPIHKIMRNNKYFLRHGVWDDLLHQNLTDIAEQEEVMKRG